MSIARNVGPLTTVVRNQRNDKFRRDDHKSLLLITHKCFTWVIKYTKIKMCSILTYIVKIMTSVQMRGMHARYCYYYSRCFKYYAMQLWSLIDLYCARTQINFYYNRYYKYCRTEFKHIQLEYIYMYTSTATAATNLFRYLIVYKILSAFVLFRRLLNCATHVNWT